MAVDETNLAASIRLGRDTPLVTSGEEENTLP